MASQGHRGVAGFLVPALLLLVASAGSAHAYLTCSPMLNNCSQSATITTSHIQIGGRKSPSSEGPFDPGRLSDGTIAEALYSFTFDKSAGRLTLVATNTTVTHSTLTGIFFNAAPEVTGITLISHTGVLDWKLAFDKNRSDGFVDNYPTMPYLRGDGFGLFNVFLANKQMDTWSGSGNPDVEILARGRSLTFVMQVTGDLSRITACSFTSAGSLILPGDKIVIGHGRFRGGEQAGWGFIGPCEGKPLVVTLNSFAVDADSGKVTLTWETASEIDNAGFALLRKQVRSGKVERLNNYLIPAQGSEFSGSAYAFVDTTAQDGVEYMYSLEDWDLSGVNTIHPPRRAVPNPKSPLFSLTSPAYNEKAAARVRLSWQAPGRMKYMVEVSSDPAFPATGTMKVSSGSRTARELTAREMDQLRKLAELGDGGVYWRVTGNDGRGAESLSQTHFLEVIP